MRTETPSSLKWLVDRRARLLGVKKAQLRQAKHSAEEADRRMQAAAILLDDLRSIDRVLSMHEIALDPWMIAPKGTSQGALLPRGTVTRGIYACLRSARGEWCSTTEVMAYVSQRQGISVSTDSYAHVRLVVRRRLKAMVAAGKIRRRHEGRTHLEGYWALHPR